MRSPPVADSVFQAWQACLRALDLERRGEEWRHTELQERTKTAFDNLPDCPDLATAEAVMRLRACINTGYFLVLGGEKLNGPNQHTRDLELLNEWQRGERARALVAPTSDVPDDAPVAKVRSIGEGKSVEQVRFEAEAHVQQSGGRWLGVNELMRRCNCGKSTIYDAIEASPYLTARKAEAEAEGKAQSSTVRGRVGLDPTRVPDQRGDDPVEEASRSSDPILARLLEAATPEEQKRLIEMPPDKQQELSATIEADPDSASHLGITGRSASTRDRSRAQKRRSR